MTIDLRELTVEDIELVEYARGIVDANTDGEDGVHTLLPGSLTDSGLRSAPCSQPTAP